MKYQVKIEYELKIVGNRGVLNPYYESYVKALDVNSGCFAKSSLVEYPPTGEALRGLKEEAKEGVLAKVREHYRAKEKTVLEAQILAIEEFELEI